MLIQRSFKAPSWMFYALWLAGIYNLVWGGLAILFPLASFTLFVDKAPTYPELWQCIGMIVAVYGLGYIIAAYNPFRFWPIVLVGLLGKILGPIGFIDSLYRGVFPLEFGINIIFNDLIWWPSFTLILYQTWLRYRGGETLYIAKNEFESFNDRKRAQFINSLSGFKSANLLGTQDKQGRTNLCLISSAFHLGASPALMGIIIRPDTVPRHSLENIRETGLCTLNHVHPAILKQAHQTSARYPKETSEFSACQLSEQYRDDHQAPFVEESHIKMALKLVREIKLEENGTHLLILSIEGVYLPERAFESDGHVDLERAQTLCIGGLDGYHAPQSLGRLSYAKPQEELTWLK